MADLEPTASASRAADEPEQKEGNSFTASLHVPASQSSTATHKKGHAPQPSVGIAASLFGSEGDDDPFSSISSSNANPEPFTASLDQVQEAEEDQEQPSDALHNVTAPSDPVSELFGSMSLDPASASNSQSQSHVTTAASSAAPNTGNDASATVPATPGGLFAESQYEDDWLKAASNDQNADQNLLDDSTGGQGSLDWANGTAYDAADYHNHNQSVFGALDAQHGNSNGAEYGAQNYSEQEYDAYGRPIGALDYADDAHYDAQQDYYAPQTYDSQASSYAAQAYGLDAEGKQHDTYSFAHQAPVQADNSTSAHDYDAPTQSYNPRMYAPQQHQHNDRYPAYDYSASQSSTNAGATQPDYSAQSQGQQNYNTQTSIYDPPAPQSYNTQDYTQSFSQPPPSTHTSAYGVEGDGYAPTNSYEAPQDQQDYSIHQTDQGAYYQQDYHQDYQQDHGAQDYQHHDYGQYSYDDRSQGQHEHELHGTGSSGQQASEQSPYEHDGYAGYSQPAEERYADLEGADDEADIDSRAVDQQLGDYAAIDSQPNLIGEKSDQQNAGSQPSEYLSEPQQRQNEFSDAPRKSQEQLREYSSAHMPLHEDSDTSYENGFPASQQSDHDDSQGPPKFASSRSEHQQASRSFADRDDSYTDESTLDPYGHPQSVYADDIDSFRGEPPSISQNPYSDYASYAGTPTPQDHNGQATSPTMSNSGRYAPYGSLSGLSDQSRLNTEHRDLSSATQHAPYSNGVEDAGYFGGAVTHGSPHMYAHGSKLGAPVSPYDSFAHSPGSRNAVDGSNQPTFSEGSNDVLRTMQNAKIPLATFGIGGKLVTYFASNPISERGDTSADSTYGAYTYNASSHSSTVTVQPMASLIPASSYASLFDPISFPGPAFDGSSSATTLSRATGGTTASKTKKTSMLKHLEERIQDLSAGIGYIRRRPSFNRQNSTLNHADAPETAMELESRRVEDKVLLLQLLKLLIENDGQTTSTAFEQSVRALIVTNDPHASALSSGFAAPSFDMTSTSGSDHSGGTMVRSYELKTTFLQNLQAMLLRGERREAVDYAVSQQMWAHAMTISSCVDKDCWKIVVGQFIEQELGLAETKLAGQGDLQGLKVAYNVFSGQDPVSIFDLFRTKTQLHPQTGLRPEASQSSSLLPSWKEAAAIVSGNKSQTDAAALTAIGDGLSTRGLIEAAHFCYLLSPQSSPMGGADTAATRFSLLGLPNPKTSPSFSCDLDGIIMTELLEYAHGLIPISKGQELFAGIPHLQAYKLVHAHALAELGEVTKAQKYCEAIAYSLKLCKNSPYLHPTLLSQLKQLSDRLVGAPHRGPGGNWVTRKMQRPTLDGVWGALEGRFTKFIAGEDGTTEADSPSRNNKGSAASSLGPFSHYSAITPDAASGGITRQQSFTDIRAASPSAPNSRSGSAMDFRGASRRAASPKHRASSALAMRSINDKEHGDWPQSGHNQPQYLGHDGSSMGPGSSRTSFEANRNGTGHGFQSSEYSAVSSMYEGAADSSYVSNNAPWIGGGGSNAPRSQGSASEMNEAGSNAGEQYSGYGGYGGSEGNYSQSAAGDGEADDSEGGRAAPGNVPFYGYQPHGAQKPQFVSNVDSSALEGEGGFVSPFDALSSHTHTPQPQTNSYAPPTWNQTEGSRLNEDDTLEEDDDLGLGNANKSKKATSNVAPAGGNAPNAQSDAGDESRDSVSASADGAAKDGSNDSASDKRQELKSSASWFGRLWGRSPSTDPVAAQAQAKAKKAHLGNEVTFYYDQELKRWVNKKAGDTGAASTPPPPPPRAQTASPASQPDRNGGTASAPPMRRQVSAGAYSDYGGDSSTTAPPLASSNTRSASAAYTVGRSTPPISEDQDEGSSGLVPSRGPAGMGGLSRARSNLADHSMPPAAQPSSARSGPGTPASRSTPPPPPPGGSKTGTVKKRPIKSRYVVVD